MTAVLEARRLGKRYGRRWALADCTLSIPPGYVVGLVGPNGAGKTTLLHLAVGLLQPTTGTIEVLGGAPASGPRQLARVGFMAQDSPTYPSWSVADHLKFGAAANRSWDGGFAFSRVAALGLDGAQQAGKLSGGQRAQLALTLALAKRPELLVLDEPVARLDPLARREFLQDLQMAAREHQLSVVLSSHLVADVERVCDYVIVLANGQVQLAGEIEALVTTHHLLTATSQSTVAPADCQVVEEMHTGQQAAMLVRAPAQFRDPSWDSVPVGLEDLVLAYMSRAAAHGCPSEHRR